MKYFNLFYIFFLLAACQDVERPKKPANLISEDAMVAIIAEAYLNNAARSYNNRELIDKGVALDSLIYKKHNIDSLQFVESNAYYASQLNTYLDIFKRVEERLLSLESQTNLVREAMNMENELQRKKDSVAGIVRKDSLIKPHLLDSIK